MKGGSEICKTMLWKWASLSLGAMLGNLEGGSLPVTPRDRYRRDLERECFSPRGLHWGTIWRELLYRGLRERCDFVLSGDLVYLGLQEICKRRLWKQADLTKGALLGNLEGRVHFTADFERQM